MPWRFGADRWSPVEVMVSYRPNVAVERIRAQVQHAYDCFFPGESSGTLSIDVTARR